MANFFFRNWKSQLSKELAIQITWLLCLIWLNDQLSMLHLSALKNWKGCVIYEIWIFRNWKVSKQLEIWSILKWTKESISNNNREMWCNSDFIVTKMFYCFWKRFAISIQVKEREAIFKKIYKIKTASNHTENKRYLCTNSGD